MKTVRSHRLLPLCIGLALLGSSAPSQAAVGVRVLLQEWSPLTPDKQGVRVITDDAGAVSDAVQRAWAEARPRICNALLQEMGKGGAAGGQTLHEMKCLLDETATFAVASAGKDALSATLAVSGYVEASSTTPTILAKGADPRFSLALTGRLLLAVSVQPNADQTLRVDKAQFQLTNATIDSHNLSGDLLEFVVEDLVPYFKGPNYKQRAEAAINSVGGDLTGRFNSALGPVNAKLRGPSAAVRVGVWGKPDAIVVAFGPRALVPPLGGTMFGALRWDTSKILAPGSCQSFRIDATVQTGPAPLRDPGGYYESGDAPRARVGTFEELPAAASGECRYRLSGLAVAWPNDLAARSSIGAGKTPGNSLHSISYALSGDGWDGRRVVLQASAERNYVIKPILSGSATIDPGAVVKQGAKNPADPRIHVADRTGVADPVAQAAPATGRSVLVGKSLTPALSQLQPGAQVGLNPQPLPPDPPATVLRRGQSQLGGGH